MRATLSIIKNNIQLQYKAKATNFVANIIVKFNAIFNSIEEHRSSATAFGEYRLSILTWLRNRF